MVAGNQKSTFMEKNMPKVALIRVFAIIVLAIWHAQCFAATFEVINGSDAGTGSLRKAIADDERQLNFPPVASL